MVTLEQPFLPFILTYDEFGKELIRKFNELFQGTKAKIPLVQKNQEIPNLYILKRLALITTIYQDSQLRSYKAFPITPLQSELLLKENKLPKPPLKYWEDLTLILYDRSSQGKNPKEAAALYESLKQNKSDLGLSSSDLESRLLIINAGLVKDSDMPHGVKPIILPGLTKAYAHETLKRTGQNLFNYGLEQGLPSASELGNGSRILYMPDQNENIGLRVLCRYRSLSLDARGEDLVDSIEDGRVTFAREI